MRGVVVPLILSMLSLTACEKDFEEKYQDNLERLQQEAREIEAGVDQQLAEGREADAVRETADDQSVEDTQSEMSQ